MKKKSVILLILLFFSTFVFSQNEDPVVLSAEQFSVKDKKGNSFYLKMPVKEVLDILGEPKKRQIFGESIHRQVVLIIKLSMMESFLSILMLMIIFRPFG